LKTQKERNDELSGKWRGEKMTFETLHNLQSRIETLRREAETAERAADLERVAQILYGELPAAEREHKAFEKKYFTKTGKKAGQDAFLKELVDEEDIAAVVSQWTGIPVSKMLESETEKLVHIEDELRKRVIGQKEGLEGSAKKRGSKRSRMRSAAPARDFPTSTGRLRRSCSSGPPGWARPSSRERSPSSCSTTRRP